MKRILSLFFLVVILVSLSSCAYRHSSKYPNVNLAESNWIGQVETSAESWKQGASQWFLTGNAFIPKQRYKDAAPKASNMSTMVLDVPQFHKIKVDGPFEVQLFGSDTQNSVYVFGPNAGIRSAVVEVRGDTLCISSAPGAKNTQDMQRVVIRVGVTDLKYLEQSGSGRIEARQLRSTGLKLLSKGCGNFYLEGHANFQSIEHYGTGCINIFGAVSPVLDICTNGSGKVNVAGNLGLRNIQHSGNSDINLIGANGGNVKVDASGKGKIGIYGRINLQNVKASGNVALYGYQVTSHALYVYASGSACVGLAGGVEKLYLDVSDHSYIEARHLQSYTANVRASRNAHINVTAHNRLFAASTGNSSVYYFGSPDGMSQFVSGNGLVMPIWSPNKQYKDQVVWKDKPVKHKKHGHKKPANKKYSYKRVNKAHHLAAKPAKPVHHVARPVTQKQVAAAPKVKTKRIM